MEFYASNLTKQLRLIQYKFIEDFWSEIIDKY